MKHTKLSKEALKEIRANAGRGGLLYRDLAKKYGVHVMTINYWANDVLKEKAKAAKRKWTAKNKDYMKEYHRKANQALKMEVLSHYSSTLECACCGERHIEFLSMDHIGGGGAKHRKEIGLGKLYHWLKKNNYPAGFRVLCMNCNHAYGHYDDCPHNKKDMFK